MFDTIGNKFNKVIRFLKGEAKITEDNIQVALRDIKLSLLEADVNYKVVKSFIENIKNKSLGKEVLESLTPHQQIIKIVRNELEDLLGNESKDLTISTKKPTIIMLTGLQGTGKTTTAGKLAKYLKDKGKTSLLCSLDMKRLAAEEQLETIAAEIQVKFYKKESDKLKKIIKGLISTTKEYGYDYIIADTAGRLHIDDELMRELGMVKELLNPAETIFVADSLTGQDAVNSAVTFAEKIGIDSIILTKIDADSRGGAALSIVKVTNKPIKFMGIGEKYSDFEKFHPERIASKIMGMGDMLSLIEKAEKEFDENQTENMARKMLRNDFTLEDFKSQMKQVQKLGSMRDIMGMLPNMGINQDLNSSSLDDKKIKHTIAIINSMTTAEREHPKIINGRRRLRVSKGSGRPVQEINQLLKNFQEIRNYMKKPFFKKMLKKFDFFRQMR